MNRTLLTKLHLVLAAFMFPAVLMFLVTGALYTWGSKGEWHEESVNVPLSAPFPADENALKDLAIDVLEERGIALPSGQLTVETGEEASLNWTGARSEIAIAPGAEPMTAEAKIKEASLHRWLVQLHKAKGSTAFKLYATTLAIVLFLLVASGVIMGLQVKALRRITITSSAVGLAAFIGFVALG